jgi:hypothetical protein
MKAVCFLFVGLLGASAAVVQATGNVPITVEVARVATRLNNGTAVEVDVTVTCAPWKTPLEAFVYVTQNGNETEFAPIPVVCRGFPRTYIVRVPTGEAQIRRGNAQASAYVLLLLADGANTESGDDTRPLKIR